MKFVDTHTHLYLDDFDDDRDIVIKNAVEDNVDILLNPNIDSSTIKELNYLTENYSGICFPMMGLHPTSVKENYTSELEIVEKELEKGKYYGVGEIGIDLYWDKTFKEQQLDAFRIQLKFAKKFKLPVSIHTRNSFEETYRIVKEELTGDLTGVFHCFTGTFDDARKIMDIGFFMGIGGVVTFKNSGLDKTVKDIPTEHLVLETDSPFLTPVPFRGKRNQSSYIKYIAEKIALTKNKDIAEIAEITTNNALNLFKTEI